MLSVAFRNTFAPASRLSWTDALLTALIVLSAVIPAVLALYFVKSAMGINVMPGPSPLHDLLYDIVRQSAR